MKKLIHLVSLIILIGVMVGCSKATEQLIVGLIKPSTDHLPVEFGIDEGIISKDDIKLTYFNSGWETNEAIASGKVDIAILPFTYVWKDVEKGLPVKIISFLERESDGIIARKGISKISDLNGKKIGVLKASTLDIFSEMVEDKYNINMEQIYFRSPMDMAVALTSGEVDALSYYVPSIFKFSDDFKIIYWYGDDWANHPCCDLAANEESIEKKNKQIRKFMKQLEISVNKLNSNLPNGYKTAKEYFSLTKENYYKSAEHQRFNLVLSESGKKFEIETIMQMKKIGYIKGDVQPSKVYEVIQD